MRLALLFFLAIAGLILAGQIILPHVLQIDSHRGEVIQNLEWLTGRKIEIDRLDLSLYRGLAIQLENLVIYEENADEVFAKAREAYLVVKILPLLRREFDLEKIVLQTPHITLRRFHNGTLNVQSLVQSIRDKVARPESHSTTSQNPKGMFLRNLEDLLLIIHEGSGLWSDEFITPSRKENFAFTHLNLVVPRFSLSEKIPFRISLETPSEVTPTYLEIRGQVLDLPVNLDPKHIMVDLQVRMRSGDLNMFLPYYVRFLPYRNLQGKFTLRAQYLGNLFGEFKSKGTLLFQDLNLDYPKVFKNPIVVEQGSIDYSLRMDERDLEISRLQAVINDFEVSGAGILRNFRDKENGTVHFHAEVPRVAVRQGHQFVPTAAIPEEYPQFEEFFTRDMVSGYVENISADFHGRFKDWHLRGFKQNLDLFSFRANVNDLRIDLQPDVAPLVFKSGTVTLNQGLMTFLNMTAHWGDSVLQQGYGTISNLYNQQGLLKLWIDGDFKWPHVAAFLGYDLFQILPAIKNLEGEGQVEARLDIEVPLRHPKDFTLNGEITTDRLSLRDQQGIFHFHEISNRLTFAGNRVEFPKSTLQLGTSTIELSIQMVDFFAPQLDFTLASGHFDFRNVFRGTIAKAFTNAPIPSPAPRTEEEETAQAEGGGPGYIRNWTVRGDVQFASGQFQDFRFDDLTVHVDLADENLRLHNLQFLAYNGQFSSPSLDIALAARNRGDFRLPWRMVDFRPEQMLMDRYQQPDFRYISGLTRATGEWSSNLLNKRALLQNLSGWLSIETLNGNLVNMKTLTSIVRILNLKLAAPEFREFAFRKASVRFQIRKGIMSTENLLIRGELCNISGIGKLDLPEGRIDGYVGIHLYEGMDKLLGTIPIFGTIVTGPDGRLMTTYFQVSGNWEDPTVTPTPFHALTSGLSRLFLKILRVN